MQFPVQQFPILDSGQMNPFHQALQSGLQNYQNLVKTQYMPAGLQADIATKQAYSQYLPMQAIETALSNPLFMASLSDEQRNGLLSTFSNMGMNIANRGMQNTGQPSGSLFQNLINHLTGRSVPPQPAMQSQSADQAPSSNSATGDDSYHPSDTETPQEKSEDNMPVGGSDNSSQQSSIPSSGISNTGVSDSDDALNDPNTMMGHAYTSLSDKSALGNISNPRLKNLLLNDPKYQSPERTQGLANIADMNTANRALWTEQHKKFLEAGNNAIDYKNLLTAFDKKYQTTNKWNKGTGFGSMPAIGSNAQLADQYATGLSTAAARAFQSRHITDMDLQTAKSMKPGRNMNPQAEKEAVNFWTGISNRTEEHQSFDTAADKLHLTPNEAQTIWTQYINDKPFYDPDKGQLIKNNLNSWQDYLSRNKRDRILTNSYKSPNSVGVVPNGNANASPTANTKVINHVTYTKLPDGAWAY